jgi:hypothetical protein
MNDSGRTLSWPALPLAAWHETYDTLHMWTQVVGKVALACSPLVNHYWNITLCPTPRGLATQPLYDAQGVFGAEFDFLSHRLVFERADGRRAEVALEPRTVADFHAATMAALESIGVRVHIWTMPVEFPDPIAFERDTVHRAYDAASANAFFRAVASMVPVFERFRARFLGKCSPVHFFWGGFDLALTRFSGRRAPERPGADAVQRESYSHEVISHGFWPGGVGMEEPAFYAYAAPEPPGLKEATVRPQAARYEQLVLGEFILPYEAVRLATSPEDELTAFLESTYDAAADLARWPRSELER